ncbi:MAG: MBL fold metallo-hydrolase [Gemmatimonadetes bacterium]|nr:MBL fold metallo-hydrolase [Gemmatimonadota bacterium]NIQ52769.1 MBL fold metallo-hydrolase [Gemmatimonadota bacterium]NIU72902.1 MBL fold metallo-hydrolase [Gammaproteobacteria bacterium]NIX47068.1 MBL fold metallo-hydrolase [Gemmatimonadota bacterium]NIY07438.1 MBL fold metallo-hydrolase [Gemmatimonadota bacterium]
MRLTFLGTGTSFGVPVIGCDCAACTSPDPRDARTRHAALVGDGDAAVLVDTPPELRLQLTRARVGSVDAVWITHCHADHIHGMDDLRAISAHRRRRLDIHTSADCRHTLEQRFGYIFSEYRPPPGTTKPALRLHTVDPLDTVQVGAFAFRALPVQHGPMTVYGFRVGDLGYITDAKTLGPGTRDALKGVRTLVLNALWFGNPHPTHLNVEEAVELAAEIGAERTYLTHITHRVRHAELERLLPPEVRPAHDGLTIEF